MKKLLIFAAVSAAAALTEAAVTITDITARQRWPWNGIVDVDFTIAGASAGEVFAIDIDATAANGATQLSAKTYVTEPLAGTGANRIAWDFGADYPEFRANDVRISVTATPVSESGPVYMVIDLAGGANAEKYPVRYTTRPPAHVQGAKDEPCQTTELWMRRIHVPDFAFTVNSYTVFENPDTFVRHRNYWGKMTKDYYIGVFELTQKQYQLVMGDWPKSYFNNEEHRASRPVEGLRYDTFVGSFIDSQVEASEISAASFLGRIRAKTGLPINLPSNIQLNFAGRGGTYVDRSTEFYVYKVNGENKDRILLSRNADNVENTSPSQDCDAKSGTAYVGSYLPNDYGLYDVIGNVIEYTSERYLATKNGNDGGAIYHYREYYQEFFNDETIGSIKANPVIDPAGVTADKANKSGQGTPVFRVGRGGSYAVTPANMDLWNLDNIDSSYSDGSKTLSYKGFRLSMSVE
ncbi:MAG: SUMF1/EgtB/PvdO family nonheme iron enzyme [Kiritimatiellae bacterium]|nr:SUMF1/EgtB/PvdO family nonheme iron enzyme [Kiritimatiellia bacterium]